MTLATAFTDGLLLGAWMLMVANVALRYGLGVIKHRLYLKLYILTDVMFLASTVPRLPAPMTVVVAGVWVALLIVHVRALRNHHDDDDDDRPKRRRRRLRVKLRMPKLTLPRIPLPAGG